MIIPLVLTLYTQPEEQLAHLVDFRYEINDYGDGKIVLMFIADVENVSSEDLHKMTDQAHEKILEYAKRNNLKLVNQSSVSLGEMEYNYEEVDDGEEVDSPDDYDLHFGSDLTF